jgi:hypothetical protein
VEAESRENGPSAAEAEEEALLLYVLPLRAQAARDHLARAAGVGGAALAAVHGAEDERRRRRRGREGAGGGSGAGVREEASAGAEGDRQPPRRGDLRGAAGLRHGPRRGGEPPPLPRSCLLSRASRPLFPSPGSVG